jgi:hypothetical protein
LGLVYAASEPNAPLRQGEIFTGLSVAALAVESIGTDAPEVDTVVHPYAIVLSQACDLEQDATARKPGSGDDVAAEYRRLPYVLFAQAVTAEDLRARMALGSQFWKNVCQNKNERYHYLEAVPAEDDGDRGGLPALGVDFKRYLAVPTPEVYARLRLGEATRRCVLNSPYLEHLATRFCYYQFRVALPRDHQT